MGRRRNIVCITLVLGIIIFGSVFEDNILPSVEAPSTTLKITAVAIGGSDTFNYTVTGPSSFILVIPTSNGEGIVGPFDIEPGTYRHPRNYSSRLEIDNCYCSDGSSSFSVDVVFWYCD